MHLKSKEHGKSTLKKNTKKIKLLRGFGLYFMALKYYGSLRGKDFKIKPFNIKRGQNQESFRKSKETIDWW